MVRIALNELTVLIIDEHHEINELLAKRLDKTKGIRVVGNTSNVLLGAELAHELQPDVIVADFKRTGPPRPETYRWLARVSPSSRIIALLATLNAAEEAELLDAGVSTCLLKGISVTELTHVLLPDDHGTVNIS
jgi:DNA-binding NarL/FixJ family response regulator